MVTSLPILVTMSQVTIDVTDGELQKIDLPILVITHKKEE